MSDVSSFDPQSFIDSSIEGANDTSIVPIPQGEWLAQVDNVRARKIDTKDGPRAIMDVTWEILDESVKEELEREKVTCRQSVFLDVTGEGSIDLGKGKNRQLGLLREAVGQNDPSRPWAPSMLIGNPAKVVVEHSPNENDPENPYSNVTRVTSM